MSEILSPTAALFPQTVQSLLQQSLELMDRFQQGGVSHHGLAVATGRLEAELERLLAHQFRCPENRKLAPHLRHEQPHIFTFLRCPGLSATNHFTERAIRWMAMARKTWGGNRTWSGARIQQMLGSILHTSWQQGKSAFDRLVKLLRSPIPIVLDIVPLAGSP